MPLDPLAAAFVAVEENAEQLRGPQGFDGKAGLDGTQGPVGPEGPMGPEGLKGPKGDPGPQGPKGDKGDPGPRGLDGQDGVDGKDGAPGPRGPRGPGGNLGGGSSSGGGGGAPSGPAGGSLGGTYPNPTVVTNADLTGDVTSVGNATTIGSGKVTEAMQVLADNTTQDVSTSKHGYAPKAPNDATKYLDGTGAYSTPAGGGSVATDAIWDAAGDIVQGTGANTAARLALGAAGTVVRSTGSANAYAFPPGYEFDYVAITSPVTVTGTAETSAGSTLVITGNPVTYDGTTVIEIEFYSPAAASAITSASDLRIFVMEGTTYLGRIAYFQTVAGVTHLGYVPCTGHLRLTPTAGAHTYLIRASRSTADGVIQAGAAGATNNVQAYLRITKV